MAREERSLSELFGDSLFEVSKLIQNEVDLARAEFNQKVSLTASAAKYIAAGAALAIPALVLLLLAVSAELVSFGLSQPLAYLSTGFVAAIVAVGFVWLGASRLSGKALVPSATLDDIRRDKTLAKELVR